MKIIVLAVLLYPAAAGATAPVKACIKWSKEIPRAEAAGAALFSSVSRVEGKGPFTQCGVVVETESFGMGWLMRAWMKEGVYSPCGERLGGFKINYKGEEWQDKVITGLNDFLVKNPGALASAKTCVIPSSPLPPVKPEGSDNPTMISQPPTAPVQSSQGQPLTVPEKK